jgi:hypothetical protein
MSIPNHNQPTSSILRPLDATLSALLTLVSAAAYTRTLYPGVLPGDGAEFQALGNLLGIAHTTGYPIYLLLARLTTLLPFGSPAYRVNLFSALMGGLTIGLVYLVGVLAVRSRWGAAVAALSMALASTFWSQAVIAEVYTPASAFLAGVLVLLLVWYHGGKARFLFLAGLLGGLSLGVHGSVGLAAPAIAVLILITRPFKLSHVATAAAGALLGAALTLAAFIAIDANPAPYNIFDTAYRPAISAWGSPDDIATPLQRFVFSISAEQWRPAMFSDPAKVMPAKATLFIETLPKDYAMPILGLMLIGAVYLFLRDWRLGLFTLLAVLCHNLYTFNYNIGDNYVFYIPGYVYLSILSAAGAAGLIALVKRLAAGLRAVPIHLPSLAVGLLLLFLAFQPFYQSRLEMLKTGQAVFEFTGIPSPAETLDWYQNIRATVAAMEPNAIGYIGWNDLFAYTYAAWVDLGRTDLRFIEPSPYSQKGGMATSMLNFIRANLDKRPQYFGWMVDRVVSVGIRLQAVDVGPTRLFRAVSNK